MRERARTAERVVVKLGTHVVTHDGLELALGRVHALVEQLAQLHGAGRQVLLVSSGAIALGRKALGLERQPLSIGVRQAAAAVGQGRLMALYQQAFAQLGVTAAQVLLTHEDLADPDRALCLRTTLLRLLELKTIPVLNENDSVSIREIADRVIRPGTAPMFGDNDGLSARVAVAVDADLLVILSDVDGLHTGNPNTVPDAQRIDTIEAIDESVLALASGTSASGSGGMASKLLAARTALEGGVDVVIAAGTMPDVLARVCAGEVVGTFAPSPERRHGRKRRIALARGVDGALVVNEGAIEALRRRKASLLPVGVTGVIGEFGRGALVELRDADHRVIGRGLVNYAAADCRRLAGHRSDATELLGDARGYDALVTRDNLILGGDP